MFERCSPDIVLLDVMLPKMSGIDVCRRLRQTSDVPIIMVTAKSSEIDTVVGLEVGADDYVTKPYRIRETGGSHESGAQALPADSTARSPSEHRDDRRWGCLARPGRARRDHRR